MTLTPRPAGPVSGQAGEGGDHREAGQRLDPRNKSGQSSNQASLGEVLHQDLMMAAQAAIDPDRATDNNRFAPPFFQTSHIRRRRGRPASWTIMCGVCERYECYLFDPFRSKHLHSLARDCPLRIQVSSEEVPPTSALRRWICPGSFWRRVGKFWKQPFESFFKGDDEEARR
jgi:hypothetical protein